MTVLGAAATVLHAPERFFAGVDPSLRSGAGVALLSGLALALVAAPLLYLLRFVLPAGEVAEVAAYTAVLLPGFAVVRWLVLTAVVYATGRLLGGDGAVADLLAYLGWSFLPNVIASLVLLVAMAAAVASVEAPTSTAAVVGVSQQFDASPLFELAAAASLVRAEAGVSLSQLRVGLGVGQFAWNAYVWFAAAKVGLSLDDRRALAAIAPPVVFTGFVAGLQHVNVGVAI